MKNALRTLVEKSHEELQKQGVQYTAKEIHGQVKLWKNTGDRYLEQREDIRKYWKEFARDNTGSIVLTGAGTSEFVGLCLEGLFTQQTDRPAKVISSTRIVTEPYMMLPRNSPILLLSFARSGNSPESVGVVEIAEQVNPHIYHLIITCNSDGALVKQASKKNHALSLVLDPQTNDRGLAMTASFTNMVVAGLAIGYDLGGGDSGKAGNAPGASPRAGDFDIDALCSAGEHLIETAPDPIVEICREDFTRAVFLGDGANYGAAKESHLKLQELTSGHVMCSYDSFLGLRHGPEAVIDEHTLVVALLSEDPYRRKYEQELLTELHSKQLGLKTVAVCSQSTGELDTLCDYVLEYDPRARLNLDDPVLSPVTVIPGQLLGLFKSLELGLQPDNPSAEGVIHRVVEGVTIYDPGAYYARNTFEIIAKR